MLNLAAILAAMHVSPISNSIKLALLAVLLVGLFFRYPFIRSGMPYFYDEDEAHHFNRVVNMVKRGTFDPEYFHKPSLHFYLRMPVVAASFLQSVRAGELKKLSDIITKDPFGVGDYSFSASHPKIAKWNRAFSVLLSLGCIVLSFLIARLLTSSDRVAIGSALIVAISPALISSSATIGVDIVMTFFCLLAALFGLKALHNPSTCNLVWTSLAAGLAISSKYNALPIAIVPLMAAIRFPASKIKHSFTAIGCIIAGFLIGTPYLFSHLNLFLDQFAYEIWHYGIAGHEGHTGEPGIGQAKFFLTWLGSEGLSYPLLILSMLGLGVLAAKSDKGPRLLIAFPLLYFLLMSDQRANFTRNIFVLIPFLAVFAAVGLNWVIRNTTSKSLFWGPFVLLLISPVLQAFDVRAGAKNIVESRLDAEKWLVGNPLTDGVTAISGKLQFQPALYAANRFERFNPDQGIPGNASRLVLGATDSVDTSIFQLEREIQGESTTQRIVKNPAIRIYRRK